MKRLFTILTALALAILCATLLPTEAQAATITQNGTCGENLTWTLDSAGTLTISGTGAMNNYSYNGAPWYSLCSSIKRVVIEYGVTSIGGSAFSCCTSLTSISIPASVTRIGDYAFESCHNLTDITLPDSVTSIGNWAFSYCSSLTGITIPASVTSIEWNAFSYCTSLTSVTIPDGVTSIGEWAFSYCTSLTSVTIPDSVTSIGAYAFCYCSNLTGITVGNGVTFIDEGAFYGCTSLSYNVYDNAKYLGNSTNPYLVLVEATSTAITSCNIYNETKIIYGDAFKDCASLTAITIPYGVTGIERFAFAGCESLTSVVIPSSVTKISYNAFEGCTSLSSVIIPDSVTSIGVGAFYSCDSLTSVVYCGTAEQWSRISIGDDNIALTSATRSYHTTHTWVGGDCITRSSCLVCGQIGEYGHLWIEATCTSLKTCFLCGATEGTEYGHVWIDATCVVPKTCFSCGATEGSPAPHVYDNDADAFCNLCNYQRVLSAPSLNFYGTPGLSFQEYIGIQVLLINQSVEDYDKVYVVAVQQTPSGAVTTTTNGILYANNYTIFEQQIVSWSMTERVTITLYGEKNGLVYQGDSITTSVKKLAEEKLLTYSTQGNAKVCRALVDMLNYGAAVQTYFNYRTTSLPNTNIKKYLVYGSTNTPTLSATNSATGTGSVPVYGDNISLQDKVEFNLMFNNADLAGKEVKATVGGKAVDVLYNTELVPGWTIARVVVETSKMREIHTIALYDKAGNAVSKIYNVSVEGYAKARQGTAKAAVDVALMRYGDSVRALLP